MDVSVSLENCMLEKEVWIEVDVVDADFRVVGSGFKLDSDHSVLALSVYDIFKYYYLNRMLGLNYQSCEYNKRLSVVNVKSGLDAIPSDAIEYIKSKFKIAYIDLRP